MKPTGPAGWIAALFNGSKDPVFCGSEGLTQAGPHL